MLDDFALHRLFSAPFLKNNSARGRFVAIAGRDGGVAPPGKTSGGTALAPERAAGYIAARLAYAGRFGE